VDGTAFLKYVWGKQPEGYHFLALRVQGNWLEIPLAPGVDWVFGKSGMPTRGDLYFCPNSFTEPTRQKHLCLPSRVMYQDLDEALPEDCPMMPDLWWETSPERYQGLWILDQVIEPVEFAQLNRALNRACHADPGTWNLTRMLRVPGSYNKKRGCKVGSAHLVVAEPGIGIA
jgi:hypothetical protein